MKGFLQEPWKGLTAFVLLLSCAVACRAFLVLTKGLAWSALDTWGLMSDLLCAALIPMPAMLSPRLRSLSLLAGIGWVLASLANVEHVLALDSVLRPTYAHHIGNATFFKGSALHVTSWSLTLICSALALGALILLAQSRDVAPQTSRRRVAGMSGLIIALLIGHQFATQQVSWRNHNVVHANVMHGLASFLTPVSVDGSGEQSHTASLDLSGTPTIDNSKPRRPNILLLVLEGVSGAYLPSFASRYAIDSPIRMKNLDLWGQSGLAFDQFITHQRQTNRGLYSLLCGDYPTLDSGTAKMTTYASQGGPRCLPHVLDSLGYRNVYLQSAPLFYMMKQQFMSRAGFHEVLGDAHFKTALHRTDWGVDDETLFAKTAATINDLQQKDQPWFLTVLNVGTHHPHKTPYPDRYPNGPKGTFRYLDDVLGLFFRHLAQSSVMNDTLVLVTSDESLGLSHLEDPLTGDLTQSWGLLIAHAPDLDRDVSSRPMGQIDVMASVLDYLGTKDTTHWPQDLRHGRSLFRNYDTPRELWFANTYKTSVALLTGDDLTLCDEYFRRCNNAHTSGHFMSTGHSNPRSVSKEAMTRYREERDRINRSLSAVEPLSFQFADQKTRTIQPGKTLSLFDGQNVRLPAQAVISIAIEGIVDGTNGDAIDFQSSLTAENQYVVLPIAGQVAAGSRFRFEYRFYNARTRHRGQLKLMTRTTSAHPARVTIQEAGISIQPRSDAPGDLPVADRQPLEIRTQFRETGPLAH